METDYKGIDYGLRQTNIDKNTGIRYGVIPHGEVGQAWYEGSEAFYVYYCPYCGEELKKGYEAKRCPACYKKINPDRDFDMQDPTSFYVDDGEYLAEQLYDDPDIFITKSPYFTYAQFCSPCAPGAGYLMNPLDKPDNGNKTYCFGHDWFEGGKAPYPVYSVKTGKLVKP